MMLQDLDPAWRPCSCVLAGRTKADFLIWQNGRERYAFCTECTSALSSLTGYHIELLEQPQARLI